MIQEGFLYNCGVGLYRSDLDQPAEDIYRGDGAEDLQLCAAHRIDLPGTDDLVHRASVGSGRDG